MADYAIYGNVSNQNNRLLVINESDWSVEKDIYPMPLTEPSNFDDNNEYWTECTAGKKLVFVKTPDGTIIAKGNVDAVSYWTEHLDNNDWISDTNTEFGVDWSWTGTSWTTTNNNGFAVTAFLRSSGMWFEGYKPAYFKISVQYSGTTPTSTIGTFASGDLDGVGGIYSSFGVEGFSRSKDGLRTIIENGYEIDRLGIVIPAGMTVSITGIWFSTQLWSPVALGWMSQTGISKWESIEIETSWNGESWVMDGACYAGLDILGSWNDIGKPSHIRFTFDSSHQRYTVDGQFYVYMEDDSMNILAEYDNFVSTQILPIDNFDEGIAYLDLYINNGPSCKNKGDLVYLNNIEFYYGPGDPTPWKGYSTESSALQATDKDIISNDVWTPLYIDDTYLAVSINVDDIDKDINLFCNTCSGIFSWRIYDTNYTLLEDWQDSFSEEVGSPHIGTITKFFAEPINIIILIKNTNPAASNKDYFLIRCEKEYSACYGVDSAYDSIFDADRAFGELGTVEDWYVGSNLYYSIEYEPNYGIGDININATSNDGPFTIYIYEYNPDLDWEVLDEVQATDSSNVGEGPWVVNSKSTANLEDYLVIIGNDDIACSLVSLQVTITGGS